MEVYYGVIYFKNGTKRETGGFSGPGAEQSCERHTAMQFEQYMKIIMIPMYIQTSAGIEMQMGLIKKLDRMNAEWTWHLVADLLPGNSLDTYRRLEYRYLPIHTDDLQSDEIKERISTFISFLGNKTNYSTEQQIKLLSVIPYVDNDIAYIFKINKKQIPCARLRQIRHGILLWQREDLHHARRRCPSGIACHHLGGIRHHL